MARYSIHLGVNQPDPSYYRRCAIPLAAAESDARAWREFAISRDYYALPAFVGADATIARLQDWVDECAQIIEPSQFLITWAGHGTQIKSVPASNVDLDDTPTADHFDEAWVMWDRLLPDDELFSLLCAFGKQAEVLVVSDSCHSQSMLNVAVPEKHWDTACGAVTPRWLAPDVAQRLFEEARGSSASAPAAVAGVSAAPARLQASALALGACRDDQRALESGGHGHFTKAVLNLMSGGFAGDYEALVKAAGALTPRQEPRTYWLGGSSVLRHQPAFTRPST